MMVEGLIQGQKVKEGHWCEKPKGVSEGKFLRVKLDQKPTLKIAGKLTLRYGTTLVPVEVELQEWNERYSEVLVKVL